MYVTTFIKIKFSSLEGDEIYLMKLEQVLYHFDGGIYVSYRAYRSNDFFCKLNFTFISSPEKIETKS